MQYSTRILFTTLLCLFALAFSLLTPYVRAKAESWGAEGKGGWMGRADQRTNASFGSS